MLAVGKVAEATRQHVRGVKLGRNGGPTRKPPLANIFFLGEKEIELRTEHSNFFIQV
jgi:hypothetical protein